MLDTILTFAKKEERIRVVGMEGSRADASVTKDAFQDYDMSYIVTDMESFMQNEEWLDVFGKRIFMQKPEAMSLFSPEMGSWFSYLMLFEDGNRLDLTLIPIEELKQYLVSESSLKILLDKDNLVENKVVSSNEMYRVKRPSKAEFDDCCNEFWWVSTYVVKGIYRKQFIYAATFLEEIVRMELLRMISWRVESDTDFSVQLGKHYKFLEEYVPKELWERLVKTYSYSSYEELKVALFDCQQLFREVSSEVSEKMDYPYPNYDENITAYIDAIYKNNE